MSETNDRFSKFEAGYGKSDAKKEKYRAKIKKHIDNEQLFVGPVQPHNSGQHRSGAYRVVYPIYKTQNLNVTLANCFACSKCEQIFLHLRQNGTGPFTSHKCFKEYHAALNQAKAEEKDAEKAVADATSKAKKAKRTVDKLQEAKLSSSDEADGDILSSSHVHGSPIDQRQLDDHARRPRYAEVIANTIESFVTMALDGKPVKASDIINDIPGDFTNFGWKKFVEKTEKKIPHRIRKAQVVLKCVNPKEMKSLLAGEKRQRNSNNENVVDPKRPKMGSALATSSVENTTSESKDEEVSKPKQSKPKKTTRTMRLRSSSKKHSN